MKEREFDLVLLGASGFTGQLVAEYLAQAYGTGSELRWAIAGRNQEKLEQVRDECMPRGNNGELPILIADSGDPASLASLVQRTRVICSTVGPYAKYGTPLVAACAEAGTDYCDLTGEVQWMAQVIPAYEGAARASGARIIHTCGYDSIPFDMGVWHLQQGMLERHGVPATRVSARVGTTRGGASGGTIASMLNMLDEVQHDPGIRKVLEDPYSLNPVGAASGKDGPDQANARYDKDFEQWTSPFVMAAVNTRVVRRSHALMGFPWGKDFQYDEAVLNRSRTQATMAAVASGVGMTALGIGPARAVARHLLPAPGDGPSRRQREQGHWEVFFHGVHPEDRNKDLRLRVTGDMDPGYGSTAKMLGEASVCLALDEAATGGGFWTPSSALGGLLQERLAGRAGLTFEFTEPVHRTSG